MYYNNQFLHRLKQNKNGKQKKKIYFQGFKVENIFTMIYIYIYIVKTTWHDDPKN